MVTRVHCQTGAAGWRASSQDRPQRRQKLTLAVMWAPGDCTSVWQMDASILERDTTAMWVSAATGSGSANASVGTTEPASRLASNRADMSSSRPSAPGSGARRSSGSAVDGCSGRVWRGRNEAAGKEVALLAAALRPEHAPVLVHRLQRPASQPALQGTRGPPHHPRPLAVQYDAQQGDQH